MIKRVTKFKCAVCGKLTAGRQPWGESTMFFPRRHKVNGAGCEGNIREAILVDVDIETETGKTLYIHKTAGDPT